MVDFRPEQYPGQFGLSSTEYLLAISGLEHRLGITEHVPKTFPPVGVISPDLSTYATLKSLIHAQWDDPEEVHGRLNPVWIPASQAEAIKDAIETGLEILPDQPLSKYPAVYKPSYFAGKAAIRDLDTLL